ncbi:hypothetical protein KBY82_09970 [Cyanobium sp. AMD-g]|uniref:tautomerase family protein n=1 Tax=Cyanobium sp. AMD-g TaxID=2823699 RepID=UPI0020CDE53C|nr:hypothetical protein [Cyanobium sp. AMD-g]MCP9931111.1 hypothetical protein [Cyanobium sp. AMD-g]
MNVQITKGASRQQKPEHTHVVIQEIDDENWGFSGMLTDDWKTAQAGTSSHGR